MQFQQEYNFSNYEFISKLVGNPISGQEVTCTEDDMSHILFDKFLEEIKYLQTFEHPSIWNHKDQREEKNSATILTYQLYTLSIIKDALSL